jgi:hypothetical protein
MTIGCLFDIVDQLVEIVNCTKLFLFTIVSICLLNQLCSDLSPVFHFFFLFTIVSICLLNQLCSDLSPVFHFSCNVQQHVGIEIVGFITSASIFLLSILT